MFILCMSFNKNPIERVRKFFVSNITRLDEVSKVLEYDFYLARDSAGIMRAVEPNDYLLDHTDGDNRIYKLKPELWGTDVIS